MIRTAIAYVRVSTERQATEDRTSLADQRAAIEDLARLLGATVERWFTDPGASGATAAGRPGFRAMVEACEAAPRAQGTPGYVLALNASRWGRFPDPEEAAYWRHHLRRLGWVVRYAEGDAEGDAAPIIRAVQSLEATTYRRNLIAQTRRGMRGAAEQGFWTRPAPFGYRRMVVVPEGARRVLDRGEQKAPPEKVRLTPHADEGAVVRWIFELYARGGESLGSLARKLKRRAPGRRWSRTVVQHLLRNDAYRGAVVGGRRRDGGGEVYGREDAHQAIVPPELWAAAQRRLAKNQERGRGVPCHYLLSGLLRCVHCGQAYTGGGGGRSRTRNPERTHRRFYRDAGGISGACPGRIGTVMRHLVDDAAVQMVSEALRAPAVRRQIERAADAALEGVTSGAGEREAGIRAALRRLQERRDRLVAAVADGAFLAAEAAGALDEIRVGLAEAEAQLHAARFARGRARGAKMERDRLLDSLGRLPDAVERATPAQRREIVEPWLGRATFDKVARVLTLGLTPLPAAPYLLASSGPGRAGRDDVGLIVRSASLLQPGHEYRITQAAEAIRRGRTA